MTTVEIRTLPEISPQRIRPGYLFQEYSNYGTDVITALECRRLAETPTVEQSGVIILECIRDIPVYSEHVLNEIHGYNQFTSRVSGSRHNTAGQIQPESALDILIEKTEEARELDILGRKLRTLGEEKALTTEIEEKIVRIIARQRALLYPHDRDIEKNTLRTFGYKT